MRLLRSGPDPLDPGRAGFAHRGLHRPGVPENSLAAFSAALEMSAGIECDLRLSADGEAMVFHDPDLRRLCDLRLTIEATPAALLMGQRLLETSEALPRLFDLLNLIGGAVPLLLELKTRDGNADRLAAAVAFDLNLYSGEVGVMSFDPRVGAWLARHRPDLRRGLVVSGGDSMFTRWWKMRRARPHFLAVKLSELSRPWAHRARSKMPLYTWTVCTTTDRETAVVHADALIWEADGRP